MLYHKPICTLPVIGCRRNQYVVKMVNVLGDRYDISSQLGQGGMAVVYRAHDTHLKRDVAIKLMLSDPPPTPAVIKLFEQEARATSRMNHPNIVQLHDFGKASDGQLFLVMELLEGRSLAQELAAASSTMRWSRIVHIALQICAALSAAHARKIVHHDLTPANCFLVSISGMRGDYIKILDFGIARVREVTVSSSLMKTETRQPIMGTPYYMAPEVLREQPCDHRVDIYGVGVLLYEMATGSRAFTQDNFYVLLRAIAEGSFLEPRTRAPAADISPAAEAVILRAMALDPTARYQSATELADALEATLQAVIPPEPTPAPAASIAHERTRWPWKTLSAASILMLLTATTWSLVCMPPDVRQAETGTPAKSTSELPSAPTPAPAPPALNPEMVDRNAELAALKELRQQELQAGLTATKDRRAMCLIRAKVYTVEYLLPLELAVGRDGRATVKIVADEGVPAESLLPTPAHACILEVLHSISFVPKDHAVVLAVTAKLD